MIVRSWNLSRITKRKAALFPPGLTTLFRPLSSSTIQVPIGKAYDEREAKKFLQFTCTHDNCKQTSEEDRVVKKYISTLAYEKGVVLVRCNCDKLHLIADRLVSFCY